MVLVALMMIFHSEGSEVETLVMLPCPFCGSSPDIKTGGCEWENPAEQERGFWIECSGCACEMGNDTVGKIEGYTAGIYDSEEEAAAAWNRRAT